MSDYQSSRSTHIERALFVLGLVSKFAFRVGVSWAAGYAVGQIVLSLLGIPASHLFQLASTLYLAVGVFGALTWGDEIW